MSVGWGGLPLLPLRCVLDHLSTEDSLAALSTCRHWRSAVLLYEGRKDTLKLRVKHLEKNLFLTRLFRKYTRKLHIYIDSCGEELDNFMNYVLPQFFDTQKLQELVFIGPTYILQSPNTPVAKLNRIITESLMFKNMHCLQKLSLLGCEMGTVKNENGRYTHKNVEYYSRPLSFNSIPSPNDTVLSRCNAGMMTFFTLQQIVLDYDRMSTETLETLSELSQMSKLTLNIGLRRPLALPTIDWRRANRNLRVALNVISAPQKLFNELMDKVLIAELPLASLKVMFCKTLHADVLQRVVRLYKETLRELVWADAPYDSADMFHRIIKQQRDADMITMCNVNPLILLCWQCTHLQRLVIHGYWVWQYDLLGFVRLRKSLEELEISAIYNKQTRFSSAICSDNVVRVLARDTQKPLDTEFVQQVNLFTEFSWSPVSWEHLHPALRPRPSAEHRADYVLQEVNRTF
ncbi:F-box only protein 33 [Pararge aegeria]|nr:F-box only protein 33 [Pararge aegeria]XP_039746152.1 F-box only protein 33 [Pararge aegeria]XP_039746160.1 F-box only protein 33 [Pararge aegeria]